MILAQSKDTWHWLAQGALLWRWFWKYLIVCRFSYFLLSQTLGIGKLQAANLMSATPLCLFLIDESLLNQKFVCKTRYVPCLHLLRLCTLQLEVTQGWHRPQNPVLQHQNSQRHLLLEFPLSVVQRTHLPCFEPARDAVEVKSMLEEKTHFIKNHSVQAQPSTDSMSQGQRPGDTRGASKQRETTNNERQKVNNCLHLGQV